MVQCCHFEIYCRLTNQTKQWDWTVLPTRCWHQKLKRLLDSDWSNKQPARVHRVSRLFVAWLLGCCQSRAPKLLENAENRLNHLKGKQLGFLWALDNGADFLFPRPADACPKKNQKHDLSILTLTENRRFVGLLNEYYKVTHLGLNSVVRIKLLTAVFFWFRIISKGFFF